VAAAAQRRGRRLHVDSPAGTQADAHRAFVVLEQRRRLDAFDRAQMLHDLFGILTVGLRFASIASSTKVQQ
jgi:hypothetical protein